jgi:hypothetical protein
MLARACVFGLVALFAVPASAAQFFIVHDAKANECAITEELPQGEHLTLVGDGAYGDRGTAAADLKASHVCTRTAEKPGGADPIVKQ